MIKENGFTFIELMIVICIIGIAAAIVIPSLTGAKKQVKAKSEIQTVVDEYKSRKIEKSLDYMKITITKSYRYVDISVKEMQAFKNNEGWKLIERRENSETIIYLFSK